MPKQNLANRFNNWVNTQHTGNSEHLYRLVKGRHAKTITPDRLVEGCYDPKSANLVIQMAEPLWMAEQPRFIAAVNWLECTLAGRNIAMGLDIDWGTNVTPPVQCTPAAVSTWIYSTFIAGGAPLDVNINYALKKAILQASGFQNRVRMLQKGKLYVASGFVRDFTSSKYESHIKYIQNIWSFNSKFRHGAHRSDCGNQIQRGCDRVLNDGRRYSALTDQAAL